MSIRTSSMYFRLSRLFRAALVTLAAACSSAPPGASQDLDGDGGEGLPPEEGVVDDLDAGPPFDAGDSGAQNGGNTMRPDGGGRDAARPNVEPSEAGATGSSDAGPVVAPEFSGVGSSIEACNGKGVVLYARPGTGVSRWDVTVGSIFGTDEQTGRGHKIFGYTGGPIASVALPRTGTRDERQARLSIVSDSPTLVAGGQYQGIFAFATWSPEENRWTNSIGSLTGATLVFIDRFDLDVGAYNGGAWCAGTIRGHAETLVSGTGADKIDFYFVAPILTPRFPR